MKKTNKKQLQLLAAVLIVLVSFVFFWVVIYAPQRRQLNTIKKELTAIEAQIVDINKMTQGREVSQAVQEFEEKFISVSSLLAANQEEVITALSKKARELNIEINSIAPQSRTPLAEKVTGYSFEELSISMNLLCELRELGAYLHGLRNKFPYLVRAKSVQIRGEGEGRPILNINLILGSYLSKAN